MRYFLLGFVLLTIAVVCIAGRRYEDGGATSRKPPIEIFPDMDRQPKLRPQTKNRFFVDGLSSRLPVGGTVAHTSATKLGEQGEVFPHEEHPFNTGKEIGTTNFVELSPLPLNERILNRGQDRFAIYCTPCHGAQGDGNGITKKIGAMPVVASLHDARIVRQPDGEIFNTITFGKNLMGPYAQQIPVEDRWAIVSYLRALQRSRLGSIEDVPSDARKSLPGMPPQSAKPQAPDTTP